MNTSELLINDVVNLRHASHVTARDSSCFSSEWLDRVAKGTIVSRKVVRIEHHHLALSCPACMRSE